METYRVSGNQLGLIRSIEIGSSDKRESRFDECAYLGRETAIQTIFAHFSNVTYVIAHNS